MTNNIEQAREVFRAEAQKIVDALPGRIVPEEARAEIEMRAVIAAMLTFRNAALDEAAGVAKNTYLFPKPTSRAARYHERIVQDALHDAILKRKSPEGMS